MQPLCLLNTDGGQHEALALAVFADTKLLGKEDNAMN